MKIKELLGSDDSVRAFAQNRQVIDVGLEARTPIWQQLDSMIEYLKVYRSDFKGSRAPVWERKHQE